MVMPGSDVHAWFAAYDEAERARKEGRAGLAWLALVGDEPEDGGRPRLEFASFDRSVGAAPPAPRSEERMALAKPVDTATRLALLVWAGMIASLAVLFG
jgi:hypothetical protein